MNDPSEFERLMVEEVRRRGRVSFDEFMAWALYHPRHGYYTTAVRPGRRGDFVTNAQTGPLFGRMLADVFARMWASLGSEKLTLVELGACDGALAESVLRSFEEDGRARHVALHLVESSPLALAAARKRLSRFGRVHFHRSLEDMEHTAGVDGCVYSNEFFDALPFHRVEWREGRWRELWVTVEGDRLAERSGPLSAEVEPALPSNGEPCEEGQQAEVCVRLEGVVDQVSRILSRGYVVTVDYGGTEGELVSPLRPRGTARTFRRHAVSDDLFSRAGERDITSHVNFSRLMGLGAKADLTTRNFLRQGAFFLKACEARLRQEVETASDVDRPSVARAVQHLLHPHGMGGAFRVLVQSKNVEGLPADPVKDFFL